MQRQLNVHLCSAGEEGGVRNNPRHQAKAAPSQLWHHQSECKYITAAPPLYIDRCGTWFWRGQQWALVFALLPQSVTCSSLSVSLQWINTRTLVLVDSHEKLHVVDRPSQEVLETLDLEQVQLVYNSRHFKSLATGGNVSQALVRD